jgi:hypothetical protein
MRLLFTLALISFYGLAQAQTTLTIIRNRGWGDFSREIDSIRISRFSDERPITAAYKDSITFIFKEPYADLYSVSYLHNGSTFDTWQRWLDTGKVKVTITKPRFDFQLTTTNSPLTQRAEKFYVALGYYRKRTDTAVVNDLLLKTYKENIGNPFSFAVGRIFYEYNEQNIQRYREINMLEREQPSEIKENIFYAMMLRGRFRNSEKLFINYFDNTVLVNAAGQETSKPFDKAKYNILFFAGKATPAAIEQFNAFSSTWKNYNARDFNFLVIYSADKEKWLPLFQKSGLPYFQLINEQHFIIQTLCHSDTRFYIVDGLIKISGFYDTFTGTVNHFKTRR